MTPAEAPAVVDITDPAQVASARARRDKKRAAAMAEAATPQSSSVTVIDALSEDDSRRVVMIPVEDLHPHPDNPRRGVGDITDLTEDVRQRGVDSPLTVIPGDRLDPRLLTVLPATGYYVVIGHRRLAASTAAGLLRVPCQVRDLTPAEQLAMMLRENVHRADLTPVEESDAIQGLLDLGLSVEAVAAEVARSESTVRRRARLAGAPEAARTAIHTGQATLEQWEEALAVAGDDGELLDRLAGLMHERGSFGWEVEKVKRDRRTAEKKAKDVARLQKAGAREFTAEELDPDGGVDYSRWQWVMDIKDATDESRYKVDWNQVSVFRPRTPAEQAQKAALADERAEREARFEAVRAESEARREAFARAAEDDATAGALRQAFVSGFRSRKRVEHEHQAVVALFATTLLAQLAIDGDPVDADTVIDALAIGSVVEDADEDAGDDALTAALMEAAYSQVQTLGGTGALLTLASAAAEVVFSPTDWLHGTYVSSPAVQTYYHLLTALGYEASPAERVAIGWPPADGRAE